MEASGTVRQSREDQALEAFGRLAAGDVDDFLESCAHDLVLEARGILAETTYVSRRDIPAWYDALRGLTGDTLESSVRMVRSRGERSTVVVRHSFERDGVQHRFDMVNICAFSDALLSQWSSFPLNVPEFACALGLECAGPVGVHAP
ncbi:MAG TPA: hypothetical protein VEG62_00105 [Acidimicrobiales bacterium]|nr:hypothetical protein [Acidimicrobiales bacterium]